MSDELVILRRTRRRVVWQLLAIVAAVGVGLPSLTLLIVRWKANREIAAEFERIAAAGEPATVDDLPSLVQPLEPEQDCTSLFVTAFEAIEDRNLEKLGESLPFVGLDPDEIPPPGAEWAKQAAAEQFLNEHADILAKLDEAGARGGSARFPVNSNYLVHGSDVVFDQFRKARGAARLLSLRIAVSARRGNVEDVFVALQSLAAIVQSLESLPDSSSLDIRGAGLNGMFCWQLGRTVGEVNFTDEQLVALQNTLRAIDYAPQLQHALWTERVRWRQPAYLSGLLPETESWRWYLTSHVDLPEALRTMRKSCDAVRDSPTLDESCRRLLDLDRAVYDEFSDSGTYLQTRYTVTRNWSGTAAHLASDLYRATTRNRIADAAIACERYRRVHTHWPENLTELTPKYLPIVPSDPYTEQPLQYRHDGESLSIASVGPNGSDDHEKSIDVSDDIEFHFQEWRNAYAEFLRKQSQTVSP